MYRQEDRERPLDAIVARAKAKKNLFVEPAAHESNRVRAFIFDFIRDKQRVVYGGTALNAFLVQNDPEEAIYEPDTDEPADIEFYSWRAMDDIRELCDRLFEAGFRQVEARMAMHNDTYAISVNLKRYCDVTYMPRNLFDVLPACKMADGLRYVHPHFTTIDYLRVINDPLTCYFRLEKDVRRLQTIDRTFPLLADSETFPMGSQTSINPIVRSFATWRDTVVVTGRWAYEFFARMAHQPPVPFDDLADAPVYLVTTRYKENAAGLFDRLQAEYGKDRVSYQEHHRFYDFWGQRGVYSVDSLPVAVLLDHNFKFVPTLDTYGTCLQYIEWNPKLYSEIESITTADRTNLETVHVSTFPYTLMTLMIAKTWCDASEDAKGAEMYATMARHMIAMRKRYLDANGLSAFDPSPFGDFELDALVGEGMTASRIKSIRIRQRERRKRPVVFKYRAGTKYDAQEYPFDNTSGKPCKGRDVLFDPSRHLNRDTKEERTTAADGLFIDHIDAREPSGTP
jgi:hypothetical protein